MSKILITGGTGFVGYHLAKYLVAQNNKVVLVDKITPINKDEEFKCLLSSPNIKIIEADLTKEDMWEKVGDGYDFVYHLISINGFKQFKEIPHEVLRVGITSTLNALNWFKEKNNKPGAKILYTSSNEVYTGAIEAFKKLPVPTPENVPGVIVDTYDPCFSYGGHKLICEMFFIYYSKAYNLRMVIVRPHYIYGPRAGYEPMIPKIIERIKNKTEPFPIMGGDDSRSYCYIDDMINGMVIAMESQKTDGGTYNIGSSEKITIKGLNKKIFNIMGWHPNKIESKDSPNGKVSHFLPDVSKLENATGWKTKTSLNNGLEKTIEWYINNPKNI